MNPKQLTRDAGKVKSTLKTLRNGSVVTTKGCSILIPARYPEKGLAVISSETYILGIYCIVIDEKFYGVSLVPAMQRIEPTSTNEITIDNEDYIEFVFDPGAVVIAETNLVKNDALLYDINEEIISRGKIPWYLGYEDLGDLFALSKHHAGIDVGANHAVFEMIVASIARDPKDLTRYYRHSVKTKKDLEGNTPEYTALRNIALGATNTTARLVGSYFADGLTSALVNPSEKKEDIEDLLRR